MPEPPLVTVLMSAFNDAAHLSEAVQSILDQTFADFEFLIIDDGSTDETQDLLRSISGSRVRIVRNEKNLGLTRSLKRGVELARGCYIARIDADDTAFPWRLNQQVAFLENHPEVGILGGACWQVDEQGRPLRLHRCPGTDLEIRWAGLFTNPFVHSTVMLRRDALLQNKLNYDEGFSTAQDYDLWTRVLRHCQGANLPEPLIRYLIREGVTRQNRQQQLLNAFEIATRTLRQELPEFTATAEEIRRLIDFFYLSWGKLPGETRCWRETVSLYWSLLDVFATKHPNRRLIRKLRQTQARQILGALRQRGFPNGWLATVFQILRANPLIPVRLLSEAVVAFLIPGDAPSPSVPSFKRSK